MKYIVEVNAKYLISVEAETPLRAEHTVLKYNGVWGALAFDDKMLKTDTFLGAVRSCETICIEALEVMSMTYDEAYANKAKAGDRLVAATDEVERLEELLAQAKRERDEARKELDNADALVDKACQQIGFRR